MTEILRVEHWRHGRFPGGHHLVLGMTAAAAIVIGLGFSRGSPWIAALGGALLLGAIILTPLAVLAQLGHHVVIVLDDALVTEVGGSRQVFPWSDILSAGKVGRDNDHYVIDLVTTSGRRYVFAISPASVEPLLAAIRARL